MQTWNLGDFISRFLVPTVTNVISFQITAQVSSLSCRSYFDIKMRRSEGTLYL